MKKYIKDFKNLNIRENLNAAIIIPDKDIIPGARNFITSLYYFENYEKILNWNRSLRFALAVCTLKRVLKMKFSLIIVLLFTFSCSSHLTTLNQKQPYSAKGFAYIYNDSDFSQKIIKVK